MKREHTGQYRVVSTVGGEAVRAFVPAPLPPEPPLRLDPAVRESLDQRASGALCARGERSSGARSPSSPEGAMILLTV